MGEELSENIILVRSVFTTSGDIMGNEIKLILGDCLQEIRRVR